MIIKCIVSYGIWLFRRARAAGAPVSEEVNHPVPEVAECPVQISHLRQHARRRKTHLQSSQGKVQRSKDQYAHQVKWKPIVGEDNDKEDQVYTEMQHVCQELKIEYIDSLQSNMAEVKATA